MLERVATRRQPFVLLKRLAPDERECVTGTETAINLLPAGVPPATRRQDPVSGRDLPVVFTTFPFTPRSWPVVPRTTNDYSQVPRRCLADCIPFLAGCSRTTNDYSQVPRRCLAGCIPLIIIGSAAYICGDIPAPTSVCAQLSRSQHLVHLHEPYYKCSNESPEKICGHCFTTTTKSADSASGPC